MYSTKTRAHKNLYTKTHPPYAPPAPVAPPPSSSSSSGGGGGGSCELGYYELDNYAIEGQNMFEEPFNYTSVCDCESMCNNFTNCTGFVDNWNATPPECHLKVAIYPLHRAVNMDKNLYTKQQYPPLPPPIPFSPAPAPPPSQEKLQLVIDEQLAEKKERKRRQAEAWAQIFY